MMKPYAIRRRFRTVLAVGLLITGYSALAGADFKEARLEIDRERNVIQAEQEVQ